MKIKSVYYYNYENKIGFYHSLCGFDENKLRFVGMALSTGEIRVNASPDEYEISELRTMEIKQIIEENLVKLEEVTNDSLKELTKYIVINYENEVKKYYSYDEFFCSIFKDISSYKIIESDKTENKASNGWEIYGEDIMLIEDDSKEELPTKNISLTIMYCRKCGHKFSEGSLFCNKCGVKIKTLEEERDELSFVQDNNVNKEKNKKVSRYVIIILLLVIGSLATVVIVKEFIDKKYDSDETKRHTHKWKEIRRVEATCTEDGYISSKCKDCGTYTSTTITASGHLINEECCVNCGYTEKKEVNVEWITNRKIFHQDDENGFVLLFSLLDEDENPVATNAVVDVRIVNDEGIELYKKSVKISPIDFSIWTTISTGEEEFKASIFINDSEITKSSKESGKVYFTVYAEDDSFYFEESELTIYDSLPVVETSVRVE